MVPNRNIKNTPVGFQLIFLCQYIFENEWLKSSDLVENVTMQGGVSRIVYFIRSYILMYDKKREDFREITQNTKSNVFFLFFRFENIILLLFSTLHNSIFIWLLDSFSYIAIIYA